MDKNKETKTVLMAIGASSAVGSVLAVLTHKYITERFKDKHNDLYTGKISKARQYLPEKEVSYEDMYGKTLGQTLNRRSRTYYEDAKYYECFQANCSYDDILDSYTEYKESMCYD